MLRKWIIRGLLSLLFLCTAVVAFLLYMTKDEFHANDENIDQLLESLVDTNRLAGFSAAVFDADSVYHIGGYGYASIADKKPYEIHTSQYIASTSKTVIGIALMQAVEQGLVELDADINQYLPFSVRNPAFPTQKITLRQLATHTSSLDYNEQVVESIYVSEQEKQASLNSFMQAYFADGQYGSVAFSNYPPGQTFNYSNIGPSLIAYIIALTSSHTFADFTTKNIFLPLGMEATAWMAKTLDSTVHTLYYQPVGKKLQDTTSNGVILYPSRDLITNIADLTTFCQAVIGKDKRLLQPSSYEELLRPQLNKTAENPISDNSGLLFFIDRNQYGNPFSLIGMNGGDFCIRTMMWFDPQTQIGIILLSNTGGNEHNRSRYIWAMQTMASFSDHIIIRQTDKSWLTYALGRYHNWSSRVLAIF